MRRFRAGSTLGLSLRALDVILRFGHARLMRAIGATVEGVVGFNAVPDDLAPAVVADGGELMNRALKAVERVMLSAHHHLEGLVILVFANFACRHTQKFRTPAHSWWCRNRLMFHREAANVYARSTIPGTRRFS